MQSKIAKFLDLTEASVSLILKKLRINSLSLFQINTQLEILIYILLSY
jgi:transcriptional regulator